MRRYKSIAVLGGAGRTGKILVAYLLNQGFGVKLLIRNPVDFDFKHSNLQIAKGDALDYSKIEELLKGTDAVLSALGQRQGEPLVAKGVTEHVLRAMQKFGISKYVVLAGINVDTPFDRKGIETQAATDWMKMKFPEIHQNRQESYEVLLQSEAEWTLVRVPMIDFSEKVEPIIVDIEDCKGQKVTAGSIAVFMTEQLQSDEFVRKAPFLAN